MGGTAFLFPGQGSQYVGMGRRLWESDGRVRALYAEASSLTGIDLAGLSFEGPSDELDADVAAQLAVYVCNEAHRLAASGMGLVPDVVTGYSLGFYSAAVAAGSLSFADGLEAVRMAGELAMGASSRTPGTMGAVIGLSLDEVEALCRDAGKHGPVWVSNVNAARQILVSGSVAGVESAVGLAGAGGALKAYRLTMGAAYHSPMMEDAAASFAVRIAGIRLSPPAVKLVSYLDASYIEDADALRDTLGTQITRRVLWKETVSRLIADGVERFVEVGPGSAVSRMVRWVDRGVESVSMEELAERAAGTVQAGMDGVARGDT